MRTLTTLLGNSQKLDGGAMFGNACGEVTVLTHAKRGMDRLEPL